MRARGVEARHVQPQYDPIVVPRQGVRRLRENFERRSGSNRPYRHDQGSARTMAGRTLLTTSSWPCSPALARCSAGPRLLQPSL